MLGMGKDILDAGIALKKLADGEPYDIFGVAYDAQITVVQASIADLDFISGLLDEYRQNMPQIQPAIYRILWYANFTKKHPHTRPLSSIYTSIVSDLANGINGKQNFLQIRSDLAVGRAQIQAFADVTQILRDAQGEATHEPAAPEPPPSIMITKVARPPTDL